MIHVVIPLHLRTLAKIDGTIPLEVLPPITQRSVFDALEALHPVLKGTIRDQQTQRRRAFLRIFACEQDLSHESIDAPLPDPIASGQEPLLVVAAIVGG